MKDFDSWNEIKKKVHNRERSVFCNTREIWWCSLGVNIGSEEDGKNDLFERPVVILKVFNKDIVRVAPLTSKEKDDKYHKQISYENRSGSVILSQIKTISTKRLSRKLCRLDKKQFEEIIELFKVDV